MKFFFKKKKTKDRDAPGKGNNNNNNNNNHATTKTKAEQAPNSKKMTGWMKSKARTFESEYERGQKLGSGAFAQVYIGIHKETKHEYAVKEILDRSKMQLPDRDMLEEEVNNLKLLKDAPSVVQFQDFFANTTTCKSCFLVLEFLQGGELFQKLVQKKIFTEEEAIDSCRCVLDALDYMHDKRVVHRDLKPENLMLANDDLRSVKLCDFGFSKKVDTKNSLRTRCGTPGFMAPEILDRWPSYDVQCDVWSFGVIMFFLLGGENPFDPPGATERECIDLTYNGRFYFRPSQWKDLSFESKDLVACCLKVDPKRRIDAKSALKHDWLKSSSISSSKKKSKRSTRISAAALEITLAEMKKGRGEHKKADKTERFNKLNAEFEEYLQTRKGDSLVSLVSNGLSARGGGGGGASVTAGGGGACVRANSINMTFEEDSPTGQPFEDFYTMGDELGKGTFGRVNRCTHKRTGQIFAVKEVDHTQIDERQLVMLKEEINVLKFLRGAPYVIRLFDVFEATDDDKTFLIMEEMKGGDLLDRITGKNTIYTEREARDLAKYLFEAVKYCHGKNIAHRDIKLENLLMVERDCDKSIKLADFGFAKRTPHGSGMRTFCGTPKYMAPEIFTVKENRATYDCQCDMWSVGVVMYALIVGYLPFNDKTIPEIKQKVIKANYAFYEEDWAPRSPSARLMVSQMLEVDPRKRLTAEQALECEWMGIDREVLTVCDLTPSKERMSILRESIRQEKKARQSMGIQPINPALFGPSKSDDASDGDEATLAMGSIQEEPFDTRYQLGEELLDTLYGQIHTATHKITGATYSVKRVVRRILHPRDAKAVNDEIAVLRAASDCAHVVNLHEVYEDADITAIVLDDLNGRPLIDQLIERKSILESDTKELTRNLLSGVAFLHKKRIANRNLTLDNLILMEGSNSDVKIYDFEFAKKVKFPNCLHTQCGVQEYLAPEVLGHNPAYDVACDMWSVGVITFLLLGGYYPFRGQNEEKTLENSRYGIFKFKDKYWKDISDDAKNLIRGLLTVDPDERITAEAALSSSWMAAEDFRLSADVKNNIEELRNSLEADMDEQLYSSSSRDGQGKPKRRSTAPKIRVSSEHRANYFGF